MKRLSPWSIWEESPWASRTLLNEKSCQRQVKNEVVPRVSKEARPCITIEVIVVCGRVFNLLVKNYYYGCKKYKISSSS